MLQRWVLVFSLSLGAIRPTTQIRDRPGQYAQADIQYGSQIYSAQCSPCHGPDGDSIEGVELGSGQFRRASSDADLRTIVTMGIGGTAMPPFNFDAGELAGIIAYLRNMRNVDAVALGDVNRGRTVFEGTGNCMSCHRVNGKGSRVAPDLSNIGTIRTANALQSSLVDPTGSMLPVNRSVRAVTPDGTVIRGRRLNEDTYSVQLIDDHEHLVSLLKANLREFTVLKTSSMPSYEGKLSSQDLGDVIAYLLSLKGPR